MLTDSLLVPWKPDSLLTRSLAKSEPYWYFLYAACAVRRAMALQGRQTHLQGPRQRWALLALPVQLGPLIVSVRAAFILAVMELAQVATGHC